MAKKTNNTVNSHRQNQEIRGRFVGARARGLVFQVPNLTKLLVPCYAYRGIEAT